MQKSETTTVVESIAGSEEMIEEKHTECREDIAIRWD